MATRTLDACLPGPHPRPAPERLWNRRGRDRKERAAEAIPRGLVERLRELYTFHFKSERRERLFLASVGFLVTFGIVRGITHLIKAGVGPFHNVSTGGLHIHHLVWGIFLLLLVGYVWLIEVGTGSSWIASLSAVAY